LVVLLWFPLASTGERKTCDSFETVLFHLLRWSPDPCIIQEMP
jgi:hypothetical protein